MSDLIIIAIQAGPGVIALGISALAYRLSARKDIKEELDQLTEVRIKLAKLEQKLDDIADRLD